MRITRDQMLMEMAKLVAQRGTCSRLSVGAVISRDGRIITTGYNGAPSGIAHCDHGPKYSYRGKIEESGCKVATHAEQNAIAFAARHGLALEGSELHVTHMPCLSCAKSIINAGVVTVTYYESYRLTDGVELLKEAGLKLRDFSLKF